MTDIAPEQRAAWEHISRGYDGLGSNIDAEDVALIAALLPAELTNPQPELPTEPGAYHDAHGALTFIDPRGKWHGTYGDLINPNLCPAPFTRLVPERPTITREQINRASDHPYDWHETVSRILDLVNGKGAES